MGWFARVGNVFRTDRLSGQLDDELAFHVAELTDDLIARGMPEAEARLEALKRFGNYTVQKERTRDMDIARVAESVAGDLRYGVRQLRQSRGFTCVAILSLALGIGANTAIFQIIDALRLRNLPVPAPEELASVDTAPDFMTSGWYAARNRAFTYAQLEQMRTHQQAFSSLFAFGTQRFNLSRGGESRFADGLFLTANALDALGVQPMIGRTFSGNDDRTPCPNGGVILNYVFWQREYGGDPAVLGRTVFLDGRQFPIIGVTPPSFFGLEPARRFDVAVPVCADGALRSDGKSRTVKKAAWWLTPIGRLKPGWDVERASNHFRDISPAIFRESLPESYRPDNAKKYLANKLRIIPAGGGISSLRRRYGNPLSILLAITGLVLLIACANLANLLLARASAREREIAVRQALGASRLRVVGQLLSESILLAAGGAMLGVVLARFLSRAMVTFIDNGNNDIRVALDTDWRLLIFTALLAGVTCVLFGLAPALRATRTPPANAMRGGRGSTSTAERNGLRRLLVVSQVALSLILLVGALLFGRSLSNLLTTETGLVSDGVLVATVDASLPRLDSERRRIAFDQLRERIATQPGVLSAAAVWMSPFGGSSWNQAITGEGANTTGKHDVWMNRVGPGYFRTMGTALLAGRDFDIHDDVKAPQVAIVNEAFAQKILNGANPVGRTFRMEASAGEADPVFQIVGVVRNTKYSELREDFLPIAFFPINQAEEMMEGISFVLRTPGPLEPLLDGIRRHLSEIHPQLLVDFRMLDVNVRQSIMRERLMAGLSGGFGLLAALLSALGLYGVLSYMVAKRRSEIGVRIAMGAMWRDILGLVFREAGRLVAAGLVLGLAGSLALSRFAESLLFELEPNDPLTIAMACALLAGTAVLATLIPARRATRLDPAVALREE